MFRPLSGGMVKTCRYNGSVLAVFRNGSYLGLQLPCVENKLSTGRCKNPKWLQKSRGFFRIWALGSWRCPKRHSPSKNWHKLHLEASSPQLAPHWLWTVPPRTVQWGPNLVDAKVCYVIPVLKIPMFILFCPCFVHILSMVYPYLLRKTPMSIHIFWLQSHPPSYKGHQGVGPRRWCAELILVVAQQK